MAMRRSSLHVVQGGGRDGWGSGLAAIGSLRSWYGTTGKVQVTGRQGDGRARGQARAAPPAAAQLEPGRTNMTGAHQKR